MSLWHHCHRYCHRWQKFSASTFSKCHYHNYSSRGAFFDHLKSEIAGIKSSGLYKNEELLQSAQSNNVKVKSSGAASSQEMVNFCANNYLGLSNHPELQKAGSEALGRWGVGMSSVRFICGTLQLHKDLEQKLATFHSTEDAILYTSCFDANAGLFETLLGPEDMIISDALNHASIIDGIRLCKARRFRFKHNDMDDLRQILKENRQQSRFAMIATDGVFSMDGDLANLPAICDLAREYNVQVYVDDSHATGFMGKRGRGTAEHFGLEKDVDIICSTLGKALGGSSGGYTTGRKEMIELLRQRSRPYLFSNSLPPVIASFALRALELVDEQPEMIKKLQSNTSLFRELMTKNDFKLMGNSNHPICPVLVGSAKVAADMASELRQRGILVVAFSYPVVPKDLARIRVQISAAHTENQIQQAVQEFTSVAKLMNGLNR